MMRSRADGCISSARYCTNARQSALACAAQMSRTFPVARRPDFVRDITWFAAQPMFCNRRITECDMVRRKNLLIDGRTAGETKYITLAGQITVWRKEDGLEECRPIVRGQIGVSPRWEFLFCRIWPQLF